MKTAQVNLHEKNLVVLKTRSKYIKIKRNKNYSEWN